MSMVQVKVSEICGAELDYAVAKATNAWESSHSLYPTMTLDPTFCGIDARLYPRGEFGALVMTCVIVPNNPFRQDPQAFCPSTEWSHCGALIAKYRVSIIYSDEVCDPCAWTDSSAEWHGDTPLIAACRAIVASKFGDTVSVPAELVEARP